MWPLNLNLKVKLRDKDVGGINKIKHALTRPSTRQVAKVLYNETQHNVSCMWDSWQVMLKTGIKITEYSYH